MADNTILNTGSGGDTLRTEDRGSFKTPTSLIDVGGVSGESLIGDAGVFMPIEGAAAHDAAAAGNPILVGGQFDDAAPDSVDEGDVGQLRMSANRNLYVTVRDAAGNERGLNVDASGQLAVTQGGTWNITNLSGTVSLPTGASTAALQTTGNTSLSSIDGKITACNTGAVVISSGSCVVTNAGTFAVQVDGDALTALQLIDNIVQSEDAVHGSGDAGVMSLAVRNDALATLAGLDGDYAPLQVNASGAAYVHVTDSSGAAVEGATQYTEADTDATITGMAVLMEGAADTLYPLQGDSTDGLLVNLGTNNDVSGTVTANAGTNLNTSALALETGGNLATVAGAVSGSEMQVDVVAALPAGSATIGNVIPIDAGSHSPDYTATGENYALSFSLDGTKTNATYAVTDISKRVLISGQTAHNSVFSGNPVAIGGVMDDTATDTVDEGDVGSCRITSRRALYTTFETPAGDSPWDDTNDALQVNVVAGAESGTEYTEDAAAPANPAGPAVALVRQDTPGAIATTDGDIVAQRATNYGAAYVQILDSSGNFINTFGGSGGTATTDDGAFVAGTGQGTPAMGFFSTDTVDAGDVGVLAMDASRRLLVSIEADNVGIGGGTQYTEGDVDATITGTALLFESSDTLVAASGDDTYGLDVDVTRVIPGTGATNLGKAVDSAAGATDTGIAPLAIRDDTLSALTPVEGDYVPLRVSATGALHVTSLGSDYTEGSSDATITGKAMMMEGAANTLYPAQGDTTDGLLVNLGANNDVAVSGTVTANLSATDNAVLDQIEVNTSYGDQTGGGVEASALRVTIASDSTGVVSIDDNGGSLTVDGTVTANLSATDNAVLDQIETNTSYGDNTGGGTESGCLRVTIANDSTGTLTVDNNGSFAVLSAGDVAHDTADSGKPVKVGAKAETALSGVTLVADGDRTDLHSGVDGVLIVRNHCNLEDVVSGNASNTDGSATQVIAAAGAGIKQYLTGCTITNTSSTDTYCEIKSGTTVKWTFPVPANGGVTHRWDPPLPPNAANEAWNFDMGAAVSTAYCSLSGFKSKV